MTSLPQTSWYRVVDVLRASGGSATRSELARASGIHRNTYRTTESRLIAAGLVVRRGSLVSLVESTAHSAQSTVQHPAHGAQSTVETAAHGAQSTVQASAHGAQSTVQAALLAETHQMLAWLCAQHGMALPPHARELLRALQEPPQNVVRLADYRSAAPAAHRQVHSAQCTVDGAERTVHSAQSTVHSAQPAVQSAQSTVQNALARADAVSSSGPPVPPSGRTEQAACQHEPARGRPEVLAFQTAWRRLWKERVPEMPRAPKVRDLCYQLVEGLDSGEIEARILRFFDDPKAQAAGYPVGYLIHGWDDDYTHSPAELLRRRSGRTAPVPSPEASAVRAGSTTTGGGSREPDPDLFAESAPVVARLVREYVTERDYRDWFTALRADCSVDGEVTFWSDREDVYFAAKEDFPHILTSCVRAEHGPETRVHFEYRVSSDAGSWFVEAKASC